MICDKCSPPDEQTPEFSLHRPPTVKLVGGFFARLCTSCRNAWHPLVMATPEWETKERTHRLLELTLASAHCHADPTTHRAEYLRLREQYEEASQALFHLAQDWVTGGPT